MSHHCFPNRTTSPPDTATYQAWRRGFAHLLLCLMAPDAPGPADAPSPQPAEGQPGGSSKAAAGWGVVGRTTSRGLLRSQPGSGLDPLDSMPGRRTTSTALQALQKLGVRVQELGRRVGPRQRTSQGSSLGERPSRRGTGESEWAGLPSSEGASGSQGQPDMAPGMAEWQGEGARRAAEHEAVQQAKRQRMVAYLQSVAQQHPTSVPPVPPVVLRREAAATPSPPAAAPQRGQPPRRRRRMSEEVSSHVRLMVSVGVQTEESALQQLLYQSARAAAPSTPPHAASAAAAPLSAPRGGSEGGDADIAAQYAAALAAAGGSGSSAGSGSGRVQQPQQPRQAAQQQQQVDGGSDADIANQWMAAMMAAGGPGGTAVGATPFGSPQPEQPAAVGPASSGGDEDVAAQYLAAMQAAMGPAGASPPAAQHQQQGEQAAEQRARQHRPPQHSPPTPGSEQPASAHSQRSFAHYSLPASASPLEQLAWHQQQRSLHQLQQGSPASGTSAVWHGGGTPGWNTPQRSQSLALGAGGVSVF